MTKQSKLIRDLKNSDIVSAHGGRFMVLHDARESQSHRPQYWTRESSFITLDGPCDCAVAEAVCLSGSIPGYFEPGSKWTFQGNHLAGSLDIVS